MKCMQNLQIGAHYLFIRDAKIISFFLFRRSGTDSPPFENYTKRL
jgi:hypothetical protein